MRLPHWEESAVGHFVTSVTGDWRAPLAAGLAATVPEAAWPFWGSVVTGGTTGSITDLSGQATINYSSCAIGRIFQTIQLASLFQSRVVFPQ